MSLTVNCFQGLRIKELFCDGCCCCSQKKKTDNADEGIFPNMVQQIVPLATPPIDFKDLIVYEDLSTTDIIVFSNNENNETLFTSVSGTTLIKAIHAAASPKTENKMSETAGSPLSETRPRNPSKSGDSPRLEARKVPPDDQQTDMRSDFYRSTSDDLVGKKLVDVLPEYLKRFLLPIYQQTLQGNYLQLTILWLGNTQLLRTFPLFNHKKTVIGGVAVTSLYNTNFNSDVERFTLRGEPEKQKMG